MARDVYSAYFTSTIATPLFFWVVALSQLILAAAVAYGVVRHRVLDVSFVVIEGHRALPNRASS